jgi:hypothetical protein
VQSSLVASNLESKLEAVSDNMRQSLE